MSLGIPQISFGGGVISPNSYSRVDLQKFGSAVKQGDNYFVYPEGGIANRMGTKFIKEVKTSSDVARMIEFEFNESQTYALEFGDQYMRIYTSGGVVVEAATTISGATAANPVVITDTGHPYANGDQIYISTVVGMTELNLKFYTVANAGANDYELSGVDGTAFTAYSSAGTSERVYTLVTPYLNTELSELKFRQSNDVIYMAHINHPPKKLVRASATSWSLTTITFAPTQAAPTLPVITHGGTSGSTSYSYRITAVAEETAEESVILQANTTTGAAALNDTDYNIIDFTAAADAERYNIYKEDNGLYGYIGSTETTTFNDKNLAADLDDTAPKLRQPFSGAGEYPEAVGLHEQRTWWGNSTNKPLTVWSSQTGQFENTNVSSPTKATDAVTLRLVTGRGNEIRHFRSFRNLLFTFTSGAVWTVGPGGNADAITPSSRLTDVQEFLPATQVPPLTIKNKMLMVAGKANQGYEIHSLGEDVNSGVAGKYIGSDLTVLARHLFENHTILEWCYIERPHRLILGIRDDGKIVCLAYLDEHQIYAWTLWETEGLFKSICSVPEGQRDVAYVVVERTINGNTVKYVEQLQDRYFAGIEDAWFVDSGLSVDNTNAVTVSGATQANPVVLTVTGHPYSNGDIVYAADIVGMTELNDREFTVANQATNTIELSGIDGTAFTAYVSGGTTQLMTKTLTGLDHLEGRTDVIAQYDGNIEDGLTVTNGSTTLANAFIKCIIGLPYTATMESLPINSMPEIIAKKKSVNALVLRVKDTRGIYAGTSLTAMEEAKTRDQEVWGDPAATLSEMIRIPVSADWDRDTSVFIQSEPGLPQTILSMTPDVNVGGG